MCCTLATKRQVGSGKSKAWKMFPWAFSINGLQKLQEQLSPVYACAEVNLVEPDYELHAIYPGS